MSSTSELVEDDDGPRSSPERMWAFSRLLVEREQLKRLGLGLMVEERMHMRVCGNACKGLDKALVDVMVVLAGKREARPWVRVALGQCVRRRATRSLCRGMHAEVIQPRRNNIEG